MAPVAVQAALAKAAQRAARLAELDMAHSILERVLGFQHPPETLPWGDAMSKSYLLTHIVSGHQKTHSMAFFSYFSTCYLCKFEHTSPGCRLKEMVDDVTTGKDKCRDASASPRESSTTASSSQAGSVSPPSTGLLLLVSVVVFHSMVRAIISIAMHYGVRWEEYKLTYTNYDAIYNAQMHVTMVVLAPVEKGLLFVHQLRFVPLYPGKNVSSCLNPTKILYISCFMLICAGYIVCVSGMCMCGYIIIIIIKNIILYIIL